MHRSIPLRLIAFHLPFWSLYAGLEYLANFPHYQNRSDLLRDTLLSLPILMAGAYFVGYVLVPWLLWRGQRWWFLLATAAMAVFVYYARWRWTIWITFLDDGYMVHFPPAKVLKNVLRDYAVIALAVCLKVIADWELKDRHNRVLQREKQAAELQFLRAQIHPHFLFNTLNNLYGLALRDGGLAAEGILGLSGLLDYMLYDCSGERIPLARELEVIKKYIELEQLRYGDRLRLRFDVEAADPEVEIAPLLLLPFVENCFKHGAATDDGDCRIDLHVATENGTLFFSAENSRRAETVPRRDQHIGLENVRRRLAMMYPGRHELSVAEEEMRFKVVLRIRLAKHWRRLLETSGWLQSARQG